MRRRHTSSSSAFNSLWLALTVLLGLVSQIAVGGHLPTDQSTGYTAQLEQLLAAPGAESLRPVQKPISSDSRNLDTDDSDPQWALLNLQRLPEANLGLQVLNLSKAVGAALGRHKPQAPRAPPLS